MTSSPISDPIYSPRMSQNTPHEVQGPGSVTATLLVMAVVFAALIYLAAPWRTSKIPRAKAKLRRDEQPSAADAARDDGDDGDDSDDADRRDDDPPGAHLN